VQLNLTDTFVQLLHHWSFHSHTFFTKLKRWSSVHEGKKFQQELTDSFQDPNGIHLIRKKKPIAVSEGLWRKDKTTRIYEDWVTRCCFETCMHAVNLAIWYHNWQGSFSTSTCSIELFKRDDDFVLVAYKHLSRARWKFDEFFLCACEGNFISLSGKLVWE
jgi:hypothetical protein